MLLWNALMNGIDAQCILKMTFIMTITGLQMKTTWWWAVFWLWAWRKNQILVTTHVKYGTVQPPSGFKAPVRPTVPIHINHDGPRQMLIMTVMLVNDTHSLFQMFTCTTKNCLFHHWSFLFSLSQSMQHLTHFQVTSICICKRVIIMMTFFPFYPSLPQSYRGSVGIPGFVHNVSLGCCSVFKMPSQLQTLV